MNKRFLTNMFLFVLIVILLIQSGYLWFSLSTKTDIKDNNVQKETDFIKEVMMPQKVVINLSQQRHIVKYNVRDLWEKYSKDIKNIFLKANVENLEPVTSDEYLKNQDKKSIVFKFKGGLSGAVFINLIENENSKKPLNLALDSIYISKSGDIYISEGRNYYKLKNLDFTIDLEDKDFEQENKNINNIYTSFYELYGIKRDVLVPKYNVLNLEKISYTSGTEQMDIKLKNNLVERILNSKTDYIREITRLNNTIYVYENKTLTLSDNGLIEFYDANEYEKQERNLYISISNAMNFISKQRGLSSKIYLEKIDTIQDINHNGGYSFYFNLKENSVPVVSSTKEPFIRVDVFSNHIRRYKEMYRMRQTDMAFEREYVNVSPIYNVILSNIKKFDTTNINQILSNIDAVDTVYIDDKDKDKLTIALELSYKQKKYYFEMATGKFLMRR